jgi:competence protein ComEC
MDRACDRICPTSSRQDLFAARSAAALHLPLLLASYAAGLAIAPYCPPWPLLPPLLLAFGLILIGCRRLPLVFLLLPPFFCALGFAQYHLHLHPNHPAGHITGFAGETPITMQGMVRTVRFRPPSGCVIDLEAKQVYSGPATRSCCGRLRLFVERDPPDLLPGEEIRFSAKLRKPKRFGTPGEFDYPRHLAAEDIFATAFIEQGSAIVRMASFSRPSFPAAVARWRLKVGRQIDQAAAPGLAPLVRALVVGDKQNLSREQTDLMARAGISHLFAISGLHLGLAALILYGIGHSLYRRSERLLLFQPPGRFLPLLIAPLLWLYLQLTGNSLSARRAFFMALAAALLLLFTRRTPPLRILLAAAFFMLCLAPLALFEPSFQLSVAGVSGILILTPRWQKPLRRLPRPLYWAAGIATATLAATVTTLPLVLLHFHLWAPAGLLTNLSAVPLIAFGAVPAGLAGMMIMTIWPPAGAALFRLAAWFTGTAWQIAERVVSVPVLAGKTIYLSPAGLGALSCAVLALLLPVGRRWRIARLGLLSAGLLPLLFCLPTPRVLSVTALSVGQGDATLLSRPDGRHYLIDGGGFYRGTFDTGARLVGPALGRLGVRSLEAVILTHDHPDHRKGLIHILDVFPVGSFWCAGDPGDLHPDLREVLRRRKIPVKTFGRGWTFLESSDAPETLAVFFNGRREYDCNDRSLVLYARYRQDGVLLTGDLEKAGVETLLAERFELPVTLLKLPHHGSRHSEPWRLTDRFHPRAVFSSQGRNNSYGLPHAEVLQSLDDRGLQLYRTDLNQTLRFTSDGRGWRTQQWRNGLFR